MPIQNANPENPKSIAAQNAHVIWGSEHKNCFANAKNSTTEEKGGNPMFNPETILMSADAAKKQLEKLVKQREPMSKPSVKPEVFPELLREVGKTAEALCEHAENTKAVEHLMAAALANSAAQGCLEAVEAIVEPERDIIRGGNQQIDDFNAKILDSTEDIETVRKKADLIMLHSEVKSRQIKEQIAEEGKWKALTLGILGTSVLGVAVLNSKKKRGFFKTLFH